jgi:thiol:disulfide interchange protein
MGAALNKGRIAALRLTHWLALLCALVAGTTAFAKEDFLPPDQAYRYAVRSEADRIVVTWTIAPGYYLYKNRMAVARSMSRFPCPPMRSDPNRCRSSSGCKAARMRACAIRRSPGKPR